MWPTLWQVFREKKNIVSAQEEEQFEDISVCEKCNEATNWDVSDVLRIANSPNLPLFLSGKFLEKETR